MRSKKIYAVYGASGKMGQQLAEVLSEEGKEFVAISNKKIINNYKNIFSEESDKLKNISCLIDFTNKEGIKSAIKIAVKYKIPLISGSTGINLKTKELLKVASKTIPIL